MQKLIGFIIIGTLSFMIISLFYVFISEINNKTPETISIHDTIYKNYSDWELLKVAIIWQESKGNSNAIGGNGYGIYQITPIYVKECNRILDTTKYRHSDVFIDSLANDMFEVVQSYHNTEKCPKKAIRLHNKGDKYYQEVMDKYNMLKYLNNK